MSKTPDTDKAFEAYARGACGTAYLCARMAEIETQRDSAKTLNRSLLDQLEVQAVQIEAMREAIVQLRDSLEVGKDSVETWDWCNKMLANPQSPTKP